MWEDECELRMRTSRSFLKKMGPVHDKYVDEIVC